MELTYKKGMTKVKIKGKFDLEDIVGIKTSFLSNHEEGQVGMIIDWQFNSQYETLQYIVSHNGGRAAFFENELIKIEFKEKDKPGFNK